MKLTPEQEAECITQRIAEYLFGATREQAIEWVKEEKFDSCVQQADEIWQIVAAGLAARERETAALQVAATRWDAIETLMILGDVELTQAEDGGYRIDIEPAENILAQSWDGDTPEQAVDKVVATLTKPAPINSPAVSAEPLAKHQPCGCVICTCEDELKCQGCGAHHCGNHPVGEIPNPVYATEGAALEFAIDWLNRNRDRAHAEDCTSREPSVRCSCGLHRVLSGLRQARNDTAAAKMESCAECGKTSTPDSIWALYCVECIVSKIAPALTEGAAQSQEPVAVAYRVIGEGGMPMTDWIDGDTLDPPAFPNGWIQRAYATPPAAPKEAEVTPLMRFYGVDDLAALVRAQEQHIQRLQSKLPAPRDEFPPSPRIG